MASGSFVRVRLHFDHATPGEARRRVWLLVDLDQCRVVADLEHVIRERFCLSARSVLNLFIDGCYLPPAESIRVVRDNDPVSVQVEGRLLSGEDRGSSKKSWRRPEVEPQETDVVMERKKSKRRRTTAGGQEESQPDPPEEEEEKQLKKKKKKEKKENTAGGQKEESQPDPPEETAQKKRLKKKKKKEEPTSSRTPKTSGLQVHKIPKPAVLNGPKPAVLNGPKPAVLNGKSKQASSSDSSDSGAEEAAPSVTSKVQKKTPRKAPAAPQGPLRAPPALGKRSQPRSSSSSSDSSSEETRGRTTSKPGAGGGAPPQGRPQTGPQTGPRTSLTPQTGPRTSLTPQTTSCAPRAGPGAGSSDSDSEEEIQLVIRRPLHRVGGEIHLNRQELAPPSATLQSPADPRPRKDYSSLPLLAAPPGAGQKIVFKLLELTENYTPEVSEYKEGKILHFDHATKQVEMELLSSWHAPAEPGKFDLVYQNADGSESVEYAVSRSGSRVTERWDSLLEPRLLL